MPIIMFTSITSRFRPQINIEQSFPSCNTVRLCDISGDYSSKNKGGYGYPNIDKYDVSKTKIYYKAPGGTDFVEIDKDFLPIDGCVDITTEDLEFVDASIVIPNKDCCNCPQEGTTTKKIGGWSDGCSEWKYEVYETGQQATYNLINKTYPNTASITIDNASFNLGTVTSIDDLTVQLNKLFLGTFTQASGVVTALGVHNYGALVLGVSTVNPTVTVADVLIATTIQGFFMHCHITNEVRNMMTTEFSDSCGCDDELLTQYCTDIKIAHETLLIAAQKEGCDCPCTMGYLKLLQAKLDKLKNNCL